MNPQKQNVIEKMKSKKSTWSNKKKSFLKSENSFSSRKNQMRKQCAIKNGLNELNQNYGAEWIGFYPTQWQMKPNQTGTDPVANGTEPTRPNWFRVDFDPTEKIN